MRHVPWLALGLCGLIGGVGSHTTTAEGLDTHDVRGTTRAAGRLAANVVVWLDAPNAPRMAPQRFLIEQRNMEFLPKVLVAPVGSTIELPNNDRVFHNVFSFTNGKPFDLGLYPTGTSKRITVDRPALSRLYCNIHPHMAAYVMAVASPYYAVSNGDGAFTMPGVPAGTYAFQAWRAGAAKLLSGSVVVEPSKAWEVVWP
jgi:plastocyanin